MGPQIFAPFISLAILLAIFRPDVVVPYLEVNTKYVLGISCFSLGLSTQLTRFTDLFGTPLGLGNLAFGFTVGTFLFPALGLACSVLALQYGFPFAVVVGLALLAACPVGGPSSAVNTNTAGGSLEASVLLSFLSTPAALITFPYAFRHFVLLLLDQPTPPAMATGTDADSTAALRAQLSQLLTTPPAALIPTIRDHAIFAVCLPLAAGVGLAALLPASLASAARRVGPLLASGMILLTVTGGTAARAEVLRAAGWPLVGVVLALHAVSWVLGLLIPAGVGSPVWTCRTTAFQASMRNPTLALALAAALFGGSPHFPLVAAPCAVSVCAQNALGAWAALLGASRRLRRISSDSSMPRSPRAFRTQTAESILRQQTVRRLSNRINLEGSKED